MKNSPGIFSRGDVDSSGLIDLTDAVQILNYLFQGGARPGCMETADVNNDTEVNLTDSVFLLTYLFLGGEPPTTPGPPGFGGGCGSDPDAVDSPGDLGCESYSGCE
ncbi:MAG: dockerin type I domain-containing protein [Planctomycetota bacterium]